MFTRIAVTGIVALAVTAAYVAGAYRAPATTGPADTRRPFAVPPALRIEHEDLRAQLLDATLSGGATAVNAWQVARLIKPHFAKEEEFALPPLSLLPRLSAGERTAAMMEVVELTDRLQAELLTMRQEHKAIEAAANELAAAARIERKLECVRFAEELKLHAQIEEQVLYPAALLVGEYVRGEHPVAVSRR